MIETRGLRKSFRSRKRRRVTVVDAVRGIDLSVTEGEIFGFLGPNGAGKTTTLRMLATLLPPDGGDATIAGADLLASPREVRRRIGYVAQTGGTWGEVSAREELALQARWYGVPKAEAWERAAAAMDSFGLAGYGDRWCKTYSGGQRRKVDIALGVIHRPKVLFLDEPTVGLDPPSRMTVWDEVRRLRDEGMTIFLTTHYLDEADALCDRIAIIDQGAIVARGTPDTLKQEVSGDVISLTLNGSTAKATELLGGQPGITDLEVFSPGVLRLRAGEGSAAIPQILRTLESSGIELGQIELRRPSLDDVFVAKTGRSLRED